MNAPSVDSLVKRILKQATDNGQPAFSPAQVDAIAKAINDALKKFASSSPM